jgi:hypothetical protein
MHHIFKRAKERKKEKKVTAIADILKHQIFEGFNNII